MAREREKRTPEAARRAREARRDRVRELHAIGVGVREMGRTLSVTHQTIRNDLAALGLDSKSAPSVTVVPVDRQLSPSELRDEAIAALRVQSSKSAIAARELARISLDLERDAVRAACEREHVDASEYDRIVLDMWNAVTNHLLGAFAASVKLRHGVDIRSDLEAAIEEARVTLNATIEARAAKLHDISPDARKERTAA